MLFLYNPTLPPNPRLIQFTNIPKFSNEVFSNFFHSTDAKNQTTLSKTQVQVLPNVYLFLSQANYVAHSETFHLYLYSRVHLELSLHSNVQKYHGINLSFFGFYSIPGVLDIHPESTRRSLCTH